MQKIRFVSFFIILVFSVKGAADDTLFGVSLGQNLSTRLNALKSDGASSNYGLSIAFRTNRNFLHQIHLGFPAGSDTARNPRQFATANQLRSFDYLFWSRLSLSYYFRPLLGLGASVGNIEQRIQRLTPAGTREDEIQHRINREYALLMAVGYYIPVTPKLVLIPSYQHADSINGEDYVADTIRLHASYRF